MSNISTTDSIQRNTGSQKPPKLLDQLRQAIRLRHYSYKTEKNYVGWVKRYIFFHNKQHPKDLSADDIVRFLNFLASDLKVSAGTQNQALCAVIFLYKHVLMKDPGELKGLMFAKRLRYIPPILSEREVANLLSNLQGLPWLMVSLLYGTAMRLSECIRLRVKDLDFDRNQIVKNNRILGCGSFIAYYGNFVLAEFYSEPKK